MKPATNLDPQAIAFNQGEAAFIAGASPDVNPYRKDSPFWKTWEDGYADAVKTAIQEA